MKSIGVDLAGLPRNPTGVAVIEFNGEEKIRTHILHTDEEIIQFVLEEKPDIVAIDAPFSFPSSGMFRRSELALKRDGFSPLSPLFRGMRPLTERSIKLVKEMRSRNLNVIEVLSSATRKVLMIDDKTIRSKYPYASRDEIDAILCALTGKLHLKGKTKKYGNRENDCIIVPKVM